MGVIVSLVVDLAPHAQALDEAEQLDGLFADRDTNVIVRSRGTPGGRDP